MVLLPIRHKVGHFRDILTVLPGHSLGSAVKKLKTTKPT